jgi:hypothetical protein
LTRLSVNSGSERNRSLVIVIVTTPGQHSLEEISENVAPPLPHTVRLQLVVDQVVLRLALPAADVTREPLVLRRLQVDVNDVLPQVGGGAIHPGTVRTDGPVIW